MRQTRLPSCAITQVAVVSSLPPASHGPGVCLVMVICVIQSRVGLGLGDNRASRQNLDFADLALRHAAARTDILHPHPAEMLRRAAAAGFVGQSDAERLRSARLLMSDVQGLLRLTLDGDEATFDEAKAPEGQQRLIAATEDEPDIGALRRRIETERAAARAIYERIVEAPARAAGWKARSET